MSKLVSEPEGALQNKYSTSGSSARHTCSISRPFFIHFKKAFDRVWHEALWATMGKYNINANILRVIENLYDKAQSAVLFNGSTGDWFRTTVGVGQGCLLSPTLCIIFIERGAVVEWLERLTVVRKVAGSSPARAKDWKTLTIHSAENGYLINFMEG